MQPDSESASCNSSLFRKLPGMDLSGSRVGPSSNPGSALLVSSEADCVVACCDAWPECTAYAFEFSMALVTSSGIAPCFLYTNVTYVVPASGYVSGAITSVYAA
jgi:hypothetical protein